MARKTKEEANRTRQEIIDAARTVFHQHGVSRSTLEQIAHTAGLTRGAVYWHFRNKVELFSAMREDVTAPMRERVDAILLSDDFADPLDAVEGSLNEFFHILDECPNLRPVLEIMALRCEYVDEFAEVQAEVDRPAMEFLTKVERVYEKAAAKGTLRAGLDAAAMARDTWVFANGLLHLILGHKLGQGEDQGEGQTRAMIAAHMALRRPH